MNGSLHLCQFFGPFPPFSFCLFVLFYCQELVSLNLTLFYYYPLKDCWFSNERQKELDLVGRRDREKLREVGGGLNQDIFFEKKSILNKREKILQYEGISLEVK